MTEQDKRLRLAIKRKFGLPPSEPNPRQLEAIKAAIGKIHASGRGATEKDWSDIVEKHCSGLHRAVYGGQDHSDLNALVALALRAAQR